LTYDEVQHQIGTWSRQNFGGQETPFLGVFNAGTIYAGDKRGKGQHRGAPIGPNCVVALEGLAPLLGMVEEVGELYASKTPADVRDALGDIAVYLCDYLSREGMVWPIRDAFTTAREPDTTHTPLEGIVIALGTLNHAHLKRHQRIRNMHDTTAFHGIRATAVCALVAHLERAAVQNTDTDLLTILNETWNKVVAKRDWRAQAADGGGAKHDGGTVILPGITLHGVINTPQHGEGFMERRESAQDASMLQGFMVRETERLKALGFNAPPGGCCGGAQDQNHLGAVCDVDNVPVVDVADRRAFGCKQDDNANGCPPIGTVTAGLPDMSLNFPESEL